MVTKYAYLAKGRFRSDSNAIHPGLACAGSPDGQQAIARELVKMMGEALGINEVWLFVLSGLLLNVTPGPVTACIIGRSIQLGWRGGLAAALGITCGCLVHVFGAA